MIARRQEGEGDQEEKQAEGFVVVPAVDVLGDEAVRLAQGRFDRVSLRGGDPARLAASFAARGARLIHVVDLDGARTGRVRPDVVARIAAAVRPAAVQASGGVRSLDDALRLFAAGADRVVVATAAFTSPQALPRYVEGLGTRLVVALDARRGRIAVEGWRRDGGLSVEDAAGRCAAAGVARVVCTAIERDGMLAGPDLDLLARVRELAGVPVLAAGGVTTPRHLDAVRASGCEGAIIGRALLDGPLSSESLWPRLRTWPAVEPGNLLETTR